VSPEAGRIRARQPETDFPDKGGLLLEHAIHFFGLFGAWLGPGRVEAARAALVVAMRTSARCLT